jgi:hypothetical protein
MRCHYSGSHERAVLNLTLKIRESARGQQPICSSNMASWYPRSRSRRVAVACALCVLGAARLGAAQQAEALSPAAQAEACIERGVAARVRGDDDAALVEFRRAFALTPTARVQGQIALAEQALGQWSDAERDLQQALAVRSDPWIQRNEPALQQALLGLQTRLATLDVRTDAPGVQVRINERVVATTPLAQPLRVAAGTVIIEVSSERFVSQRRTIEIAPRALSREAFTMVARSASSESAQSEPRREERTAAGPIVAPQSPPPPRALRWMGPTVVGGVGAAVLVSSAVFAALRGVALGQCPYDEARMGLACTTDETFAAASAGPTWTTATNVTLVAGGALLLSGGAWLAINAASSRSNDQRSARRVWSAPIATNTGLLLMVGGAL